jgi:predicted dinucleotide-binding enzyme
VIVTEQTDQKRPRQKKKKKVEQSRDFMTTIGILGSGGVAETLAAAFASEGYKVMLGTRDPAKLKDFVAKHEHVTAGSVEEAAKFGSIIVLAVKGGDGVPLATLNAAGKANLGSKVLLDACNPIGGAPDRGVLPFVSFPEGSLGEHLQAHFPDVRLVKCWNTVGASRMYKPKFENDARPTMPLCGNDAAAKAAAAEILDKFGWDSKDFGTVHSSGPVEALCQLWCLLGFSFNQWTHAFKLLEK